ncbi:hypothetical protein [Planktothrix pseudagardhii]|uniref:Uncharacterized protein n=1 Tax=Planktothrix pseudagardhii TaxID=132604 RepID=A0A9W4D8R3_9CYAN|nr:hypothetical protein [Planktothrix pseudagardhii]CAD5963221.1 hypothetical protein NO713_03336 [Planktothrix pseudagardhii]
MLGQIPIYIELIFCEVFDVEQYYNLEHNSNDRWQWQVYDRLDQSIRLHSLNVEFPVAEVYRRINFEIKP